MPHSDPIYDVVVVGAGAAGLMCALVAGQRGRRVAVLEHADRIGKKILISGGGRCNFTNIHCRPEHFLSANPHFAKSALARYTPSDFLALVRKHGIAYHEKTLGQLFCDRSAREIVTMLEAECRDAGVAIHVNQRILAVRRSPDQFVIETGTEEWRASSLVIATGGLSIPKMGATPFGYDVARQFGLKIQPCRPALVPLTLSAADRQRWCDLSGLSTEVIATADGKRFREKMLITHRGLSGPSVLQVSSYLKEGEPVQLDLAPEIAWTAPLKARTAGRSAAAATDLLRQVLAARLAERWMDLNPPDGWTNRSLDALEAHSHAWRLWPTGTEGYDKAEVTAGGVDTGELSAKTMESRKVPGLFFIGEVVDVIGHLGGFNFQWAWASGAAAGQAV